MICLWRICFSACLLAWPVTAGSVTGRVALKDSRATAVRKHSDYSGVVVWLETPSAKVAGRARMVQKDKHFSPHILPVQVGTTVDFPNYDPIFHNAFSNFSGQLFDLGLYAPGTSKSIRFQREGVVRIFCNIHAAMSAVIVVVNSPYFAVSGEDGAYTIPNVPEGPALLRVFHERSEADVLHLLDRHVTVTAAPVTLPEISISESGYLTVPHKNKYGKDYHAAPEDSPVYTGGVK
jgi:plastocyanin